MAGKDPLVEDVGVGRRRLVAPQAELGRQHHLAPGRPGPGHGHPGRQVGHPGAGQHGVGVHLGDDALDLPGPERRRLLPRRDDRVLDDRVWRRRRPSTTSGSDRPSSQSSCSEPTRSQVVLVRRRPEHPFLGVVVELAPGRGVGDHAPVRDVLAVAAHGQPRRVTAARMSAVGRLHHGQDPVGRDPDPVPQPLEVVERRARPSPPRRAGRPRPPRRPSSRGSEKTRLPAGSAAAAWTSATSGTSGSSRPSGPNGESTTRERVVRRPSTTRPATRSPPPAARGRPPRGAGTA